MRENLYFIAIVAPGAVAAEVNAFKHDIEAKYNSKAALRTMPHITLKAPFKLPADSLKGLLDWFENIALPVVPFTITLKNFGSFDNSHSKVIYVQPVMSPELIALQSAVIHNFAGAYPKINRSTHEHEFTAHMTIAYRDLTPENFDKAWAVYKDLQYTSAFVCNSFCLLQHTGMRWEIISERFL